MSRHENKTLKGWLVSGAGNTFAIEVTDALKTARQAQKICELYKVDGYLGLQRLQENEFKWNFFNSDGSDAEFCGNAARCAQDYLNKKANMAHTKHQTPAGEVRTWTEKFQNWVQMPSPQILEKEKGVKTETKTWRGFWCNTGVPHYVIVRPKMRHDQWIEASRELRTHTDFGARGTNVTWVQVVSESKTQAVTYERGVEDFTQACGTGALATALWRHEAQLERETFNVSMPGGELTIICNETGWRMTGPVEKLGDWSDL